MERKYLTHTLVYCQNYPFCKLLWWENIQVLSVGWILQRISTNGEIFTNPPHFPQQTSISILPEIPQNSFSGVFGGCSERMKHQICSYPHIRTKSILGEQFSMWKPIIETWCSCFPFRIAVLVAVLCKKMLQRDNWSNITCTCIPDVTSEIHH